MRSLLCTLALWGLSSSSSILILAAPTGHSSLESPSVEGRNRWTTRDHAKAIAPRVIGNAPLFSMLSALWNSQTSPQPLPNKGLSEPLVKSSDKEVEDPPGDAAAAGYSGVIWKDPLRGPSSIPPTDQAQPALSQGIEGNYLNDDILTYDLESPSLNLVEIDSQMPFAFGTKYHSRTFNVDPGITYNMKLFSDSSRLTKVEIYTMHDGNTKGYGDLAARVAINSIALTLDFQVKKPARITFLFYQEQRTVAGGLITFSSYVMPGAISSSLAKRGLEEEPTPAQPAGGFMFDGFQDAVLAPAGDPFPQQPANAILLPEGDPSPQQPVNNAIFPGFDGDLLLPQASDPAPPAAAPEDNSQSQLESQPESLPSGASQPSGEQPAAAAPVAPSVPLSRPIITIPEIPAQPFVPEGISGEYRTDVFMPLSGGLPNAGYVENKIFGPSLIKGSISSSWLTVSPGTTYRMRAESRGPPLSLIQVFQKDFASQSPSELGYQVKTSMKSGNLFFRVQKHIQIQFKVTSAKWSPLSAVIWFGFYATTSSPTLAVKPRGIGDEPSAPPHPWDNPWVNSWVPADTAADASAGGDEFVNPMFGAQAPPAPAIPPQAVPALALPVTNPAFQSEPQPGSLGSAGQPDPFLPPQGWPSASGPPIQAGANPLFQPQPGPSASGPPVDQPQASTGDGRPVPKPYFSNTVMLSGSTAGLEKRQTRKLGMSWRSNWMTAWTPVEPGPVYSLRVVGNAPIRLIKAFTKENTSPYHWSTAQPTPGITYEPGTTSAQVSFGVIKNTYVQFLVQPTDAATQYFLDTYLGSGTPAQGRRSIDDVDAVNGGHGSLERRVDPPVTEGEAGEGAGSPSLPVPDPEAALGVPGGGADPASPPVSNSPVTEDAPGGGAGPASSPASDIPSTEEPLDESAAPASLAPSNPPLTEETPGEGAGLASPPATEPSNVVEEPLPVSSTVSAAVQNPSGPGATNPAAANLATLPIGLTLNAGPAVENTPEEGPGESMFNGDIVQGNISPEAVSRQIRFQTVLREKSWTTGQEMFYPGFTYRLEVRSSADNPIKAVTALIMPSESKLLFVTQSPILGAVIRPNAAVAVMVFEVRRTVYIDFEIQPTVVGYAYYQDNLSWSQSGAPPQVEPPALLRRSLSDEQTPNVSPRGWPAPSAPPWEGWDDDTFVSQPPPLDNPTKPPPFPGFEGFQEPQVLRDPSVSVKGLNAAANTGTTTSDFEVTNPLLELAPATPPGASPEPPTGTSPGAAPIETNFTARTYFHGGVMVAGQPIGPSRQSIDRKDDMRWATGGSWSTNWWDVRPGYTYSVLISSNKYPITLVKAFTKDQISLLPLFESKVAGATLEPKGEAERMVFEVTKPTWIYFTITAPQSAGLTSVNLNEYPNSQNPGASSRRRRSPSTELEPRAGSLIPDLDAGASPSQPSDDPFSGSGSSGSIAIEPSKPESQPSLESAPSFPGFEGFPTGEETPFQPQPLSQQIQPPSAPSAAQAATTDSSTTVDNADNNGPDFIDPGASSSSNPVSCPAAPPSTPATSAASPSQIFFSGDRLHATTDNTHTCVYYMRSTDLRGPGPWRSRPWLRLRPDWSLSVMVSSGVRMKFIRIHTKDSHPGLMRWVSVSGRSAYPMATMELGEGPQGAYFGMISAQAARDVWVAVEVVPEAASMGARGEVELTLSVYR